MKHDTVPWYKARIKHHLNDWRPIVGLTHWVIDASFDEFQFLAAAEAKPEYMNLLIGFNVNRMKKDIGPDDDALSFLVLHELCHGPLWGWAAVIAERVHPDKYASYTEELAVSNMARAIWRARYGAEYEGGWS